jgi:amidase
MKAASIAALCVLLCGQVIAATQDDPNSFTGRWEVTTTYPGGFFVAGLDLTAEGSHFNGRSGYLVPDFSPFKYAGELEKDGLHLSILAPDGKTSLGSLVMTLKAGALSGKGTFRGMSIALAGRRPLQRPSGAPTVHDFTPQVYYRDFSGATAAALHIFPGDTVRTKTLDANGADEKGVPRALPNNPLNGPFYIEGAMIGDTIAVHFNRIRPNRDTAVQVRDALLASVLPPGYRQQPTAGWSRTWKLDREQLTATPEQPSDKLSNLKVKLLPMIGCAGVAPYWDQSAMSAHLGNYGGNLDYNEIREGTTLYLPVYQAGALLYIGDGHALQEDGEITGQGFETSMDVEFTVDLVRDELFDQPWAQNADSVMVSGIGGSMQEALQLATGGLSNWLRAYYGLNSSEVATVLASSIHYDVAETGADPETHVVARIGKDVLGQLPQPAKPGVIFCQPQWGCALD